MFGFNSPSGALGGFQYDPSILSDLRGQQAQPPTPAPASQPAPAAPQPPAADPYKPRGLDVLWGVLAGYSPGTVTDALTQRHLAAVQQQAQVAQQQQTLVLADHLQLDDRERLTFLANPAKWAEENATRYAASTLPEGGTRLFGEGPGHPGGSAYTAPKIGMSGDTPYVATADGTTFGAPRAPTFAERSALVKTAGGSVYDANADVNADMNGGQAVAPATGSAQQAPVDPISDLLYGNAGRPAPAATRGSYLQTVQRLESGGLANPDAARNGSSTGRFQFHPSTFNRILPGGDINSPADQQKAAELLAQQNAAGLQARGLPADDASLYLAHQQGVHGAGALLSAPEGMTAVQALRRAGVSPQRALQSITGNVGARYRDQAGNWTASQFVDYWRSRYGAAAGAGSATPPASPPTAPLSAPRIGGGRVLFQAPLKASENVDLMSPAEVAAAGYQPGSVVDRASKKVLQEPPKGGGDDGAEGALSPDALQMAAEAYAQDGTLTQIGSGKVGAINRAAVMNAAAKLMGAQGLTGVDLVQRQAQYKANSASLRAASVKRDAMEQAEQTMLNNIKLARGAISQGGGAPDVPFLSGAMQDARINSNRYPAALQVRDHVGNAAEELAKVMSNNTGSGAPSDSARAAAHKRMNEGMPPQMLEAAFQAAQQEVAGRVAAQRDNEKSQLQRLRGMSTASPPQTTAQRTAQVAPARIGPPKGAPLKPKSSGQGWTLVSVQ